MRVLQGALLSWLSAHESDDYQFGDRSRAGADV
jgi:hypothetical protein